VRRYDAYPGESNDDRLGESNERTNRCGAAERTIESPTEAVAAFAMRRGGQAHAAGYLLGRLQGKRMATRHRLDLPPAQVPAIG